MILIVMFISNYLKEIFVKGRRSFPSIQRSCQDMKLQRVKFL